MSSCPISHWQSISLSNISVFCFATFKLQRNTLFFLAISCSFDSFIEAISFVSSTISLFAHVSHDYGVSVCVCVVFFFSFYFTSKHQENRTITMRFEGHCEFEIDFSHHVTVTTAGGFSVAPAPVRHTQETRHRITHQHQHRFPLQVRSFDDE